MRVSKTARIQDAGKPEVDAYLAIKDVCRFLSISRSQFYVLLDDKELGLADLVERPKWAKDRIRIASWRLREWAAEKSA